jgi:hypothetical protein
LWATLGPGLRFSAGRAKLLKKKGLMAEAENIENRILTAGAVREVVDHPAGMLALTRHRNGVTTSVALDPSGVARPRSISTSGAACTSLGVTPSGLGGPCLGVTSSVPGGLCNPLMIRSLDRSHDNRSGPLTAGAVRSF